MPWTDSFNKIEQLEDPVLSFTSNVALIPVSRGEELRRKLDIPLGDLESTVQRGHSGVGRGKHIS